MTCGVLPAGLRLRQAQEQDLPFLRELYLDWRAAELAVVPWPDAAKNSFLLSQFELQHRHYLTHYDSCDFLVVEQDATPIGRFYVRWSPVEACLVDIMIGAPWRGRGYGSLLVTELKRIVATQQLDALALHVGVQNPAAQRLYERLGFIADEPDGSMHLRMSWHPV